MRSLLDLEPITDTLLAAEPEEDTQLFTEISPARPNRWRGFTLSIAIHVLVLTIGIPLSSELNKPSEAELWARKQRLLRTMRLRIPEPLYLASTGVTPPPEKKPAPARKTKPAAGSAAPKLVAQENQTVRRRLQLPTLPQQPKTPNTILQPQFAPDEMPATPIQLPEVFFWTPQTELPRFVQAFKMPGYTSKPAAPRLLDAPPRLEVPASEPSPLHLAAAPDFLGKLQVPAGPALPVQTSDAKDNLPRTGISTEMEEGDPTTLLSLSRDPQRLGEFLSVPGGNQLGLHTSTGAPGPVSAAGTGDRPGGISGKGVGNGSGNGSAQGFGSGNEGSIAALRDAAIAAAAASRIIHPAGGVFDVVVQSSGTEGLPESAGVLSGEPIYSVYLKTGATKEWILQYCIPGSNLSMERESKSVVRLRTVSPVGAPYPLITMRPPVKPRPGHYLMVHGLITPAGRFANLQVLGRTQRLEAEIVLGVLEQWRFRPAVREGKPVLVEMLLALPED